MLRQSNRALNAARVLLCAAACALGAMADAKESPGHAPGGLSRRADWQMQITPPGANPWAEITSIDAKSPAARARLKVGDHIVQVYGITSDSESHYLDARR